MRHKANSCLALSGMGGYMSRLIKLTNAKRMRREFNCEEVHRISRTQAIIAESATARAVPERECDERQEILGII